MFFIYWWMASIRASASSEGIGFSETICSGLLMFRSQVIGLTGADVEVHLVLQLARFMIMTSALVSVICHGCWFVKFSVVWTFLLSVWWSHHSLSFCFYYSLAVLCVRSHNRVDWCYWNSTQLGCEAYRLLFALFVHLTSHHFIHSLY